eukprot:500790_1
MGNLTSNYSWLSGNVHQLTLVGTEAYGGYSATMDGIESFSNSNPNSCKLIIALGQTVGSGMVRNCLHIWSTNVSNNKSSKLLLSKNGAASYEVKNYSLSMALCSNKSNLTILIGTNNGLETETIYHPKKTNLLLQCNNAWLLLLKYINSINILFVKQSEMNVAYIYNTNLCQLFKFSVIQQNNNNNIICIDFWFYNKNLIIIAIA